MKILVVEDEKDMNSIITKKLSESNYLVDSCYDGITALEYMEGESYDAAILDVMIPGINGFNLLSDMRKKGIQTPVMFLTAKSEVKDIVKGLDIGASDYLIKPVDFNEMLARLRVLLRQGNVVNENIYRCADLELDVNTRTVTRQGREIKLTTKEYDVLLYLMRNQNIVITRPQIEANVWTIDSEIESNIVDVYIRYLRKKIDDDYDVKLIHTIRGVGYIFKCM